VCAEGSNKRYPAHGSLEVCLGNDRQWALVSVDGRFIGFSYFKCDAHIYVLISDSKAFSTQIVYRFGCFWWLLARVSSFSPYSWIMQYCRAVKRTLDFATETSSYSYRVSLLWGYSVMSQTYL